MKSNKFDHQRGTDVPTYKIVNIIRITLCEQFFLSFLFSNIVIVSWVIKRPLIGRDGRPTRRSLNDRSVSQ